MFREVFQSFPEKTDYELYKNSPVINEHGEGFNDVVYTGKSIDFYVNGVVKKSIDVADFLRDGMVDDVTSDDENLIITFNTDSKKKEIKLPISKLFNPVKSEIDTQIGELSTKIEESNVDSIPDETLTETTNKVWQKSI